MDLSIIIVNYNSSGVLGNCLRSIYASAIKIDHEIIVVDNSSTDDMLKELKSEFPGVNLIELPENIGFAAGNNVGIAAARGGTLLLLNPDTIVEKDAIDSLYNRLSPDRSISIIGPKILYTDRSLQSRFIPKKVPTLWYLFCEMFYLDKLFPRSRIFNSYFGADFNYEKEQEVGQICGACLMIKKKVIDKTGPFDEKFFLYFDEADLCLRVSQAGFKMLYFPKASIVHLEGASSASAGRKRVENYYRTELYFFRKHYGIFQTCLLYCLNLTGFTLRFLTIPLYLAKDRNANKVSRHFWAFIYHLNLIHLKEAVTL